MAGENTLIHRDQGGDHLVIEAGGTLDVKTGGKVMANGTQASALAALTAASGTADGTVDDVGGAFNQATLNNNFKECATKINGIVAALQGVGILP